MPCSIFAEILCQDCGERSGENPSGNKKIRPDKAGLGEKRAYFARNKTIKSNLSFVHKEPLKI